MIHWRNDINIYLHRQPVDFRKAINGLCVLVQEQMNLSPFQPALFVFCNRSRDKVKADQALAYIQQLYAIERDIKDKPINERHNIRQQQAKPFIDKLKIWLDKTLQRTPPKTALGKAVYYLHEQWERLIRYLDDGAYPIDNNQIENSIRPFAIGRKNWMFSNSQAGAKASANLYSLVETAKANGLNPYEYLRWVFTLLPNATSVEEVERLLPWEYHNQIAAA